jgi:hypothetical protein
VLGHCGLGDPELGPDDLGDGAGALLAVGEQLQNPPADGITEHIERMHVASVSITGYISQHL